LRTVLFAPLDIQKLKINIMSFIKTTNGTNLFYIDWGTGAPVILVHGWSQNTEGWEYLIHHLNDNGFRCIAFDQRGCGRSDQPWRGYDYHSLAEDLAVLIEKLGLDNVVLVGHSMGCGVITQYLADFGESRVQKAVFIGTITPGLVKSASNPQGIDRVHLDAAVDFMKRDRPAFVYSLVDDFFGPPSEYNKISSYFSEWIIASTLKASARAAIETQKTAVLSDQKEELKSISLPVLILHGDKDTNPIHLSAEPTHQCLVNSTLKIYPGRHHGMYLTEPEMIAEAITEFVNQN
jgi:non-heme chloroperoxidase